MTTFHSIDPTHLEGPQIHRMLTGIVMPRPIAWVSSISPAGVANLAPYSFFTAVASRPPSVLFSVGKRRGAVKDTLSNIQANGEFVVHMVDEDHIDAMNITSGDWAPDEDEFDMAHLEKLPSDVVSVPRIASANLAMEAQVTQLIELTDSPNTLVIGKIVKYHIHASVMGDDGFVDANKFKPVTRLGRGEYGALGNIFTLERPTVTP